MTLPITQTLTVLCFRSMGILPGSMIPYIKSCYMFQSWSPQVFSRSYTSDLTKVVWRWQFANGPLQHRVLKEIRQQKVVEQVKGIYPTKVHIYKSTRNGCNGQNGCKVWVGHKRADDRFAGQHSGCCMWCVPIMLREPFCFAFFASLFVFVIVSFL